MVLLPFFGRNARAMPDAVPGSYCRGCATPCARPGRLLPFAEPAAELLVERRQVGPQPAGGAEGFTRPIVVVRRAGQPGQRDVGVRRAPVLPGGQLAFGDGALQMSPRRQKLRESQVAA